jgi:glycine/D-amino acid oxidase-like deaminating enzyme
MEPVDTLIIGAGVIGMSVALRARLQHPGWRITLTDRGTPGCGATSQSAGLMPLVGATAGSREFARRSSDIYLAEAAEHVQQLDATWIVRNQQKDAFFDVRGKALTPCAIPTSLCAEGALAFEDHVLRLDVGRWIAATVARLRAENVDIFDRTEIIALTGHGDVWVAETSDGRAFSARTIVVASGPWLAPFRFAGAWSRQHRVKRVAALEIQSVPPVGAAAMLFYPDDQFLLPLADRWLFSYRSERWDVDPTNDDTREEDHRIAAAGLARFAPLMATFPSRLRAFCDSYTANHMPYAARAADRLIHAGGGSGAGIRFAPAVAEEASRLLEEELCSS